MSWRGRLGVLVLALLLALGGSRGLVRAQMPTASGASEAAPTRTVSVTGAGEVSVRPDAAIVRLGVQTEAATASETLAQNSARMQALIEALRQGGVAAEDVQTQVVRLVPQRAQSVEPRQGVGEVTGYLATNIVEVTVRQLAGLGEVIDAAVRAGGNTLEGVRFQVSEPEQALTEARRRAMQDAIMAAEQLAGLAGAEIGEVLAISEARRAPPSLARAAVAEAAAVPVEPGTETVEVTVSVTWRLQ